MDPELTQKLAEIEAKVDKAAHSAEQTRKYILWTVILSLALFIIPLIALMFVIPQYLNTLDINSILSR
jgi:hypothetical protein